VKVVVLVKRVPDTETRVRIGADGASLDPTGVRFVMNPYDEFALEAALRLKESGRATEVVALTLGGDAAQETLRSALAVGADRALLLRGASSPDGLATAKTLRAALASEGPDLVLAGIRAVDGDQAQVGPMLATLLDWGCVTAVSELDVGDGVATAIREIEGGRERVELSLPALVTMTKGPVELRRPSLQGIMAAKKKPLETRDAEPIAARVRILALDLPPERAPGKIVGEGPDAVPELVRLLREEAGAL
jgi:electron transfer flavoprotein beta subunit